MVQAGEHWYPHEDADAYLLTSAWHLSRAAQSPATSLLAAPGVSATLFCAFAAESYVNVALLVMVGEAEYAALSKIPVRSKYFLAGRLGAREAWFDSGDAVLEDLSELFTQRNKLAHGEPQREHLRPVGTPRVVPLHADLTNVARWLSSTIDAVSRLARSHGDLASLGRVADYIRDHETTLRRFDPARDSGALARGLRRTMEELLTDDHEPFMDDEDLAALLRHKTRIGTSILSPRPIEVTTLLTGHSGRGFAGSVTTRAARLGMSPSADD